MHRGLNLAAHKDRNISATVNDARVPGVLTLTVGGPGGETSFQEGERVLLGQPLDVRGSMHSPVSGQVLKITAHSSGVEIQIRNDGLDELHASVRPISDFASLPPEVLRSRIRAAGIVGLGGAAFPTETKLSVAADRQTRVLILNGVECEPFISCDDALIRTAATDVFAGARVLMHACGASECVIAIEQDKPEAIAEISRVLDEANDTRFRLGIVRHFYPAGGERQLIETVIRREVPSGGIPADLGVICQNVGTAAAVARLVASGLPLVDRIVTVAGHGIATPQNLRVRFGTPIANLIAECGGYTKPIERLVIGGSMMGIAQENDAASIGADTNCIIAATKDDLVPREAEMPCIRCGDCSEVCPAGLLPQQLLRFARANDAVALSELGLRDCIECGCCDYVCPSQIPLTAEFKSAKRRLGTHRQP